MPRDTGVFKIKEKVLVAYTDKHYEAKVMKAEKREGLWYYFIHYPGWNRDFDEWVEAPGLVKFDPSLVNTKESSVAPSLSADAEPAACEDVHQFESTLASLPHTGYKAQQSQPQHPVRPKTSQSDKRPKKRVRKADDNAYNKSWDSDQSMQLEFELPVRLKQVLLDEYDCLAQQDELPILPCKPCVADILSQYVEESNSEGLAFEAEVANGLQLYFDTALQHMLLYPQEQDRQYIPPDGAVPSSIYGGSHLLRLLVKMPEILPTPSAASQDRLQAGLVDFIVFLEDNAAEFFTSKVQTR
ncbi:hypothetical protein ABBQ38_012829 [Trebouxia sp. C0009 RCD-2024]